jgi:transposase
MQQQIADLLSQVQALSEALRLGQNGRKSNTSSTPPSQDMQRANSKSLREKSGKAPGGQPGHEGSTLAMAPVPDKTVEHRPVFCKQCGEDLSGVEFEPGRRAQEIIIPPVVPQYVEHISYTCTCQKCGTPAAGALPGYLKGNIQYGPEVGAMAGYLSARQYIPHNRIAEMMGDIFNIPLSEGTVGNMLGDLAAKALPAHQAIQARVGAAGVVGGDETGIKINGKKGWLFTFQTAALTFLTVSFSRGFDSIQKVFKDGFAKAVYVSDCLPAQLKTPARAHQLCLAHLLRELNNFTDVFQCGWSASLKAVLKEAMELKKLLAQQGHTDYQKGNGEVKQIEQRLTILLAANLEGKHQKIQAFANRLNKNRDAILTFLYHKDVPPDNNASERAIRNAKVKMKVSGQFKGLEGANCFAILRSIIDTAIKNGQNPLRALYAAAYCTC